MLMNIALPNMTFETIVLTDATLESSMEFVYKHLDKEEYGNLTHCVKTIGGRLTDLELFVQKVKSGMGPEGTVNINFVFRSSGHHFFGSGALTIIFFYFLSPF